MSLNATIVTQESFLLARFHGRLDEGALAEFDQHVRSVQDKRPAWVVWSLLSVRPLCGPAMVRLLPLGSRLAKAGGGSVILLPEWVRSGSAQLERMLASLSIALAASEQEAFKRIGVSPAFLAAVQNADRAALADDDQEPEPEEEVAQASLCSEGVDDEPPQGLIAELQDGIEDWLERFGVGRKDAQDLDEEAMGKVSGGVSDGGFLGNMKARIKSLLGRS